jgi:hypothetical protein
VISRRALLALLVALAAGCRSTGSHTCPACKAPTGAPEGTCGGCGAIIKIDPDVLEQEEEGS